MVMISATEKINDSQSLMVYSSNLLNVVRDWDSYPYTELLVTDGLTCPKEYPEVVFHRDFLGV